MGVRRTPIDGRRGRRQSRSHRLPPLPLREPRESCGRRRLRRVPRLSGARRRAAARARTPSTRRPTAFRVPAGTSSATRPCRSTCPACPRRHATVKRLVIAKGTARAARLLLVPVARPGDLRGLEEDRLRRAGPRPAATAPTGPWFASRFRSVRNDEARADAAFRDLAPRILARASGLRARVREGWP